MSGCKMGDQLGDKIGSEQGRWERVRACQSFLPQSTKVSGVNQNHH
jgi:hypothetical protein